MKAARFIYLGLIYLFLYLPIAVVVFFSFNNSYVSLLWHGFTWHWYLVLFQDADMGMVVLHSVWLGLSAASVATVLGLVAAVALFRYRFFGKNFLQLFIFIMIILPDLVLGVSLLILMNLVHFPLGFWSLFVAHITFCLPFTVIIIGNQLRQLDKHILEAGRDLGASEWQLYRYVILPLVLPGFLSSALLSFTMSFDDVVISYFVSGPSYEILPLKIYSMVKLGVSPEVNALCTLLLLLTFSLAVISFLLQRPKKTQRKEGHLC
jgi:spermidine/putrescine transport system permease protein